MFDLDDHIAELSHGGSILIVLLVATLLGLRHATDPDHLAAVTTLMASGRENARRRAAALGAWWGLGHALTLVVFGVPILLFEAYLPDLVQRGAETAVAALIVFLAVRLLVRHRHRHEHSHQVRNPLAAFGIGLVHGMGGSAGVGVLLLAAIPSTALAVTSLVVLALFTAVSMTMVTTGLGATLASSQGVLAAAAPAFGIASFAFGCWYAEERLEPGAFGYYAGGAGDELALTGNAEAWRGLKLRPRVLVDVADVSTATTVLGTPVSMPLLVAPTAIQKLAHPDGEPGMARAAAGAGTVMCLSTLATATPAEVAAAAPDAPRWFQLYVFRDRGVTRSFVEQAVDHGYGAIVLTVDAPWLGRRERDLRTGFRIPEEIVVPSMAAMGEWEGATPLELLGSIDPSLTWDDLAELRALAPLPLVLKGIQTAEDALLAVDHGADAIVVSNHGGRQLDAVAPTAALLPEIVEAVAGRIEVYVDGGIRRGSDVVKALALGARAVLAGRAPLWGLASDGEAGARRVLDLLQAEIELALALCGCASPEAVSASHLTSPAAQGHGQSPRPRQDP